MTVIAVDLDEIRTLGANAAIVRQQVRFYADAEGWATKSLGEWAEVTGLSTGTVHRVLRDELAAGRAAVRGPANGVRSWRLVDGTASRKREARRESATRIRDAASRSRDAASRQRDASTDPAPPTARARSEIVPEEEKTTAVVVEVDDDAAFEAFWQGYPKRNGQRVGKKQALAQWRKLTPEQRARATAMLPTYARAARGYPKDAERYLKHHLFDDLDEHARPASRGRAAEADEAGADVARMFADRPALRAIEGGNR